MPLPLSWVRRALVGVSVVLVACGSDDSTEPVDATGGPATASQSDAGTPPPASDAGATGLDAAAPGPTAPTQPTTDGGSVPAPPAPTDGAPSTSHPLAGRYAVRTVSYAVTPVLGQSIVNKGVLVSTAEVGPTGVVTEQLCFLEVLNEQLVSWAAPADLAQIPASTVPLVEQGGEYVRARDGDRTRIGWSTTQPADCVAGTRHSSGCLCAEGDSLPTAPNDCRLVDPESDGKRGLRLAFDQAQSRPADLSSKGKLGVFVAAVKAIEWRLPTRLVSPMVGKVSGTLEQKQLAGDGVPLGALGNVQTVACPSASGHVQLVQSNLTCAQLLAARTGANIDSLGLFDAALDGTAPAASTCTGAP